MQYRVIGNVMPAVEMRLEYGESVFTQSGGMAWMSEAIAMETNTHGGFMKGLGRLFAGRIGCGADSSDVVALVLFFVGAGVL